MSEIMGIAHRSGGRVGDGFALFPPVFPRSSALLGYTVFAMIWLEAKTLFEEGVFTCAPRSTCHAAAEAEQWLCSQMD